MIKNWNTATRGHGRCGSVAFIALAATLMLSSALSPAQESGSNLIEVPVDGKQTIDAKEIISGGAVVGINFLKENDELDPSAVYVYFNTEPNGDLQTSLTTVDGRYVYQAATTLPEGSKQGLWGQLQLTQNKGKPLNTGFLTKYNESREVAILVTDSGTSQEERVSFPVRWGSKCATETVRIRVNAEGADAYFISRKDSDSGKLVRCDKASDSSQFKFDHNCDMRSQDVKFLAQLGNLQIIRKRGATYDDAIPINIAASDMEAALAPQNCRK